jgi:hypothetical protein
MKCVVLALLIVAFICCLPLNVSAKKKCEDDSIASISDDGGVVTMRSGSIWQIDAADRLATRLWLSLDDVSICSELFNYQGQSVKIYTIINTDSDGAKAGASRLR